MEAIVIGNCNAQEIDGTHALARVALGNRAGMVVG